MEINGSIKGDLAKFHLNFNKENSNLFAILRVNTRVKAEKAAATFGDAFTAVVFGGMRERQNGQPGVYEFPYTELKPRLVGQRHALNIGDVEAVIFPKIVVVKPNKSEAEVIATVELPVFVPREKSTGDVSAAGKKMLGSLAALFGKVVSVKLQSKQMPLDLKEPEAVATKAGSSWGRSEVGAPAG